MWDYGSQGLREKTVSKSGVLETETRQGLQLVISGSRAMVLSAVPGPGAQASPETLSETQILRPRPRSRADSESLRVGPAVCVLPSPSPSPPAF